MWSYDDSLMTTCKPENKSKRKKKTENPCLWKFDNIYWKKKSDVPSSSTHLPTVSDFRPIMLNLPTYLKSDVINGRSLMNHQRISPFYFCSQVLLEIHRNSDWKEFLKSCESFLRKSQFSKLRYLNPGFGRPWDMLGIFFVMFLFITLQKKSFGQKFFWIPYIGTKVPFC